MKLENLIERCKLLHRGMKDYRIYEHYKHAIADLNLPPDQYEAAIRHIAAIIGV